MPRVTKVTVFDQKGVRCATTVRRDFAHAIGLAASGCRELGTTWLGSPDVCEFGTQQFGLVLF
jgi:hypothetical protein